MIEERCELRVSTAGGTCPIVISPGARRDLVGILGSRGDLSRVFLVTDSNVDRHHGREIIDILRLAERPVERFVVPAGERSKSADELVALWRALIRAGCDRSSLVVALGGGVVGDLAGFVAATVLRGIDFIQVPTTLLSMVDASVGGKTGIDLPEGKNLVGAFHQPRAVLIDLDLLRTLPERELRAGFAEVIKVAAVRDLDLFGRLESGRDALLARDPGTLGRAVADAVRIKASVVEADERESGLRRILNFGHTLAHAIETAEEYGGWLHGEAVSVGMCFAARLGESLGATEPGTHDRLRACLESYGLPVTAAGRGLSAPRILDIMSRDKKKGPAGIRWVLLPEIGRWAVSSDVPAARVEAVLEELLAGAGARPQPGGSGWQSADPAP